MSSDIHRMDDDKKFTPRSKLDESLQRELDEALGEMSIDSLMDESADTGAPSGKGEQVRVGTVVAIHGDDVFIDMGGRSEGVLPVAQFDEEPLPEPGDSVEVTIEGYDQANGLLMLSRKGAVLAASWETLEEGQTVEGRVTGHNKGGLELTISGVRAFMPVSQIELFRVDELGDYMDQKLQCQVMEVDRAERNVIVSRRALLELQAERDREAFWQEIQEGQTVQGTVRSIMPYGAFVSIGSADGLLHVSDMSYSRVEDPKDVVEEGQNIQVKILKVDRDARKISLGLKQAMPDPWEDASSKWAADAVVSGRVTRLADFGAFVELAPGVEGLIPISEMSFQRIGSASEVVREGDVVKVRVLNVDIERKRISLSLKRVGDDPWTGASVRWPQDEVVSGVVTRLAEFGAFVELTPGVEGLVHISELSDSHVRTTGDVVREGQLVQAKVLSVDEDKRRISLSIKQAALSSDYAGPANSQAPSRKVAPKRKTPLKGGLD